MKQVSLYLLILLVSVACSEKNENKHVLPFIGNFDIEYRTVDGKEVMDTVYPKMIEFEYLNQDSVLVKSTDMKGKIWIADFFFTSCPTICPTMTTQMKRLAVMTKDLEHEIQFMSFSINPTRDTPTELTKYIKHHGIEADNWQFFTGDEEKTHALGINHFQLFAGQDASADGGYAHSPAFTLVDKEGYVRGVYVGTETDQVNQLEKDLRKLLKYEYNSVGSR
jgi:protein SCO1/2